MKKSNLYLPLLLGVLILFSSIALPSIQTRINSSEHDHDDHLQSSYIPCDCGNPGCTGNIMTCPWALGRPYPAPALYQQSNGNGGVYLSWSSSYGVTSYKVYRRDSEFGTYILITTTSSSTHTYTDYPSVVGTYWYKVDACNSNGARSSNIVSCMGGPIPATRLLFGGANRTFPNIVESKLGFTISTIWGIWGSPYISFKIKEMSADNSARNIKLHVDGIQVWQTTYNIPTGGFYINSREVYQLRESGGHVIELEINSGYIENGAPHYLLEYIKIGRLEFNHIELYEGKRYSPGLCYEYYTAANDYAFVAVDTRLYFDNDDLIISGSTYPSFRSSIAVWLDPDHPDKDYYPFLAHITETFYLYSVSTQWKIIDPDGNYLSWYQLDTGISIHSNYGGSQDFEEIEQLFEVIELLVGIGTAFLPPYLDIPFDLALKGLTPDTDPPYSTAGNLDENTYLGSWTTGNIHVPGMGDEMAPKLTETTVVFDWGGELISGNYGYYQVVITWKVDVHTQVMYSNVFGGYSYWHDPEFILSDTYYINFQYV